ncbi:capsular biosynthesis protein [Bacillus coahuilensis p1.1.43]|uniref:non-specific protein-tyrosine kinase n=1 Tax=Bacillus coahuilensis p1.1.43 TaxID=1150625 RepID=A0A147K4J4_9BACI|nr:CpsD/CapB family tyrosine-protein kinase [Bacillus coahuilensis]KUP04309.1 capsular biosynthesis protein [Bacillus coahuilensis p1.1.43]
MREIDDTEVTKLARKKKTTMMDSRRKLISQISPKSPITEQYRTIRTNIQFSAVDQEVRSLLVTSSFPGEGKSTTSANLGVVFAQQGKKVLFVDADLRKPTVHYTFNVNNLFGLTTVLTKQKSLIETVQGTKIEGLDVLPCGPIPPNPAELLGSRGMEEFLREAYETYDLVIFDTPPVLAVTDAQILANQCDGTILVVSAGTTEIEGAQKAKELLTSAKAKLLGVVLNNKSNKSTNYYYYYGTK